MDFAELVLNPVRLRVLQRIRLEGECTAKDIAAALEDVPRATVYRQVKALEEGGAIRVERTRHVRGAVEKAYALSERLSAPRGRDARSLSAAAHLASMGSMDEYLARELSDPVADRVFFQTVELWATDEEYDELLAGIARVLEPYARNGGREGRRRRSLSLVSAPPEEADGGQEGDGR